MADASVLSGVKSALGITGSYQDATLSVYIDEVVAFMADAGVSQEAINSLASVGVISRGVSDLWNYGAGQGKLSDYFMMRVTQLSYKAGETDV